MEVDDSSLASERASPSHQDGVSGAAPPGASNNKQLSLKWPDYSSSMVSVLKNLKDAEDFIDVTLACHGKQFTAHKVILSACSPYFRKLLKNNPCQHPIVILRDVTSDDLSSMLNFMYNGEVQIPEERLKDFMKTADMLQVQGLAEAVRSTATKDDFTLKQAISTTTHPDPRVDNGTASESPVFGGPSAAKRNRVNGPESPSSSPNNADHPAQRWAGLQMENNNLKSGESLLSQALEKQSTIMVRSNLTEGSAGEGGRGIDDSASDTTSDRPESLMDGMIKNDADSLHRQLTSPATSSAPLFPPGLEALYRQAGFPFMGLSSGGPPTSSPLGGGGHNIPGLPTSVPQVGLQSHAGNPSLAGKLDMMRVRATDPRPCPKCGKIYRSAHTLRTHMEDKHTICPGYRCVLCGTVAKSRNSLHSHMSRQHRGISTKDLPVVPMPAPFDADLASRLLAKAGVKSQQFPLPPSMPTSAGSLLRAASQRESGEYDDVRTSLAGSPFGNGGGHSLSTSPRAPHPFGGGPLGGINPKDIAALAAGAGAGAGPGGVGSALLDTYLSMIAAAGGDTNPMAAALSLQNRAALAATMAAQQRSSDGGVSPSRTNGDQKEGSSDIEERDEGDMTGELGSDAENDDDISDNEDDAKIAARRAEAEREGAGQPVALESAAATTAAN